MSMIMTHKILLTSLVLSMTMVGCKKTTASKKPSAKPADKGTIAGQVSDGKSGESKSDQKASPSESVTQVTSTLGQTTTESGTTDQQSGKKDEAAVQPPAENPAPAAGGDQPLANPSVTTNPAGDPPAAAAKDKPADSAGKPADVSATTPSGDATSSSGEEEAATGASTAATASTTSAPASSSSTSSDKTSQFTFGRNIVIENSLLDLEQQTVNLDSCKSEEARQNIKVFQFSNEGVQRYFFILKALAKNIQNEKNILYLITELEGSTTMATTRTISGDNQRMLSTSYINKISSGLIQSTSTQIQLSSVDQGKIKGSGKELDITSLNSSDSKRKKLTEQICRELNRNNFLGMFQHQRFSINKENKGNHVDVLSSSIKVDGKAYGILLQLKRYASGAKSFILTVHNKGTNNLLTSVIHKYIGDVQVENKNNQQSLILKEKHLISSDNIARLYQTADGKVVFAPMSIDGKFANFEFKKINGGYVFLAQELPEKLPTAEKK